ncbi:MAG TPA: rod shape-determining protein MreD [Gaiellaceae bacterium]|nr:rod shape-determining protein MreD [Gaiellaceae bacterium]
MTGGAALRASGLVLAFALLQVGIVSSLVVLGGAPDLLLVAVVSLGLLRGSVPGAAVGFGAGLLVDVLTLGTLGLTSLVLTLAGFWAGRYAETTARSRRLSPLLAVGVITVLATVFAFLLHYLLGEAVVAQHVLVGALLPSLAWNVLLALPVHAVVRAATGEPEAAELAQEVEVLV